MATPTSLHRLRKELRSISRAPPDHITARPLPSNMLHWYFVLEGPPGSPYAGGAYLGRLTFPSAYPFKPPAVYVLTPQGRFKPDTKLCLSMSDFHPETWNPLWSVGAVLTGLLTFMLLDEDTVGSISTSDAEKRALARASHAWNRRSRVFSELFPEFLEREKAAAAAAAAPAARTAQRAVSASAHADADQRRRGNDADKESLPSLLAWLAVFVGVLYYVFRLITST